MKSPTYWCIAALVLSITFVAAACSGYLAMPTTPEAQKSASTPLSNAALVHSTVKPTDRPSPTPEGVSSSTASAPNSPAGTPTLDRWAELLLKAPFPYLTPLPPAEPSTLDGVYAKFESREDTPVPCRRCPDYAPSRGVWRLQLEKGVFRVYYEFWNWTSIGSYSVKGNQIEFYNDPNCIEDVGTYTWNLDHGQLTLTEIKDDCAIQLRGKNFAMRPWLSCQPPNREAAITDHWRKPQECR